MRTICTLAVAMLAVGCHGSSGAVSVRWRIVDLSQGDVYDPKHDSDGAGQCCPFPHIMNRQCDAGSPWVIRSMAVTLTDPASNVERASDSFHCGIGEETTSFTLPTGTFAIGLFAEVVTGTGTPTEREVPPPEIHTIVKGDIVNLPVVEIGVNPLTPPPPPVPLPPPP